jgi:hypothetical protein
VHRAIARIRDRLGIDAAALVAAIPLPAARAGSALVSASLAAAKTAAPFAPALGTGGIIAMSTGLKITVSAVVLAAAGAAAVLVLSNRNGDDAPQTPPPVPAPDPAPPPLEPSPPPAPDPTPAPADTGAARTAGSPAPVARPAPATGAEDFKRAGELAKAWAADALQVKDPALRERAIRDVEAAMLGTDPVRILAALLTLPRLWGLDFERNRMQARALDLLESESAALRRCALNTTRALRLGPEALDRVAALAADPDAAVRRSVARAIVQCADSDLTGAGGDGFVRLLADEDRAVVRETLSAIDRIKGVSEPLVIRVIELTKSEEFATRRNAIAALGGVTEKTDRIVDGLLAVLRDSKDLSDRQGAGRALRRLPPEQETRTADAVVPILESTDEPVVRSLCLTLLGDHGGETHLRALEAWAANEMVPENQRKAADTTAKRIRARLRR